MKKVVLVVLIVLVFGGFIVFQKLNNSNVSPFENISSPAGSPVSGKYKDGSYTGKVTDATFGDIQVKVTIQGGKITDIVFLQFPNKAGHTTEVSNSALPILKQEAIAAQSADVDNVSGATQTSDGFKITLQSALDQAKIS